MASSRPAGQGSEGAAPGVWGVQIHGLGDPGPRFGGSKPRCEGGSGPQCEYMGWFRHPTPMEQGRSTSAAPGQGRTSPPHPPVLAHPHTEPSALGSRPQRWELMGLSLYCSL